MENVVLILKGILIGIGKIIPGVSGAMIAISLGVYERGVDALSNPFKHMKKNVGFLVHIGIGIIMSIIFFSKIMLELYNMFHFQMMLFFIGLIAGGTGNIRKKINIKDIKNLIIIIFLSIIAIIFSRTNITNNKEFNFGITIILGFIETFTMIVPGISGTAIFNVLGYYNTILLAFSTTNIVFLFPFGIGLILGIIIVTNLINYLFKKYKEITFVFIYGLSLSSIILMLKLTFSADYSFKQFIIGLLLLIIGYNVSYRMEK